MKKDKKTYEYKGILMESQEEVWFAQWLQELKKNGYIVSWDKVTKPIELTKPVTFPYIKETVLKTKIKREEKTLTILNGMSYTPDFSIFWTEYGWNKFGSSLTKPKKDSIFYSESSLTDTLVEIKPKFDQNNMTRDFVTKQKFIFDKLKIFVNLIFPEELFEDTFMPEEAMFDFIYKVNTKTKKKGEWKTNYIPKTLKQFVSV